MTMTTRFSITDFKWPIVFLCAVFMFVSLVVFKESHFLTTFAVVSLSVLMLAASWSWEHFIVYGALFVSAVFMELLCVSIGLWSYGHPFVFGIPLWVPFVWSNSALFIIELKEVVDGWLTERA